MGLGEGPLAMADEPLSVELGTLIYSVKAPLSVDEGGEKAAHTGF